MKRPSRRTRTGFTIVELLVVVGVIGVLIALLLPALSGVQRRGRKADETASLRQIGMAFSFYATTHNDAALPGYIAPNAQNNLNDASTFVLNTRFPDGSPVPAALAATWPWRLAAQFDYDPGILLGHRSLEEMSDPLRMADPDLIDAPYGAPGSPYGNETTRAETIAFQPAFGYNAYYVGGWFLRQTEPGGARPRPRFRSVNLWFDSADPNAVGGAVQVLARQASQIRSADLVLFCATTATEYNSAGTLVIGRQPDNRPGTHVAVPRFIGTTEIWRQSEDPARSGSSLIQALRPTPDSPWSVIPIARHGNQVASLRADLSVRLAQPGTMDDQRIWVNGASRSFRPTHQNAE